MIKRLLALIPRSLVHRVPRDVRDRWRRRLLTLEGRLSAPQPERTARTSSADAKQVVDSRAMAQAVDELVAHVRRVDGRVAGIERRLDEVLAEFGQLDSRLSSHSSGEAPSPLDGLAELTDTIETLIERLPRLDGGATNGAPSSPTRNERAHVRAVGHDDA